MKLSDVLIRMLWVGADHHFYFLHPVVNSRTGQVGTLDMDKLLQEIYALRNPEGAYDQALQFIDDEVPDTWYDHLHLFEEFYATRS